MNIDSTSPTDFLHDNYMAILDILSGLNNVKYRNREKTTLLHKNDDEGVLRITAETDELLKQIHKNSCDQLGIKNLKIPNIDELEAASARTIENRQTGKGTHRKIRKRKHRHLQRNS
ncbi:hypothetical protein CEXT_213941 [Caerostris extrusa]|uniref:Uncharacterized protein n=1 Tax=Caerostris extrusa TaxID=172846 RepID=A0AAV4XGK4_CAEEX|nr:hypothetical protein CEXT_213941 [Caerostris extrusa]